MDRLACVDVPALPLQLLSIQHPAWHAGPMAVVEADRPLALVRWVNRQAREGGVLPGMRYGAALSLVPALRAAPVPEVAVAEARQALLLRLRSFSPGVEPLAEEPGMFWLDATGLTPLFASSEAWARALREELSAQGFQAGVVVGFRRFGTYATARLLEGRGIRIFAAPAEEEAHVRGVALDRVGLPPEARDLLARLAVHTVEDFVRLPGRGIGRRFGPEAHRLHRLASGDLSLPLSPTRPEPPLEEALQLEWGETSGERLVFHLKPLVDRLLFRLTQREQALVALRLRLALDGAPELVEEIRTAEPTLSSIAVMELVRLRLEATPLPAPVEGLVLTATPAAATPDQLQFFAEPHPHRDRAAAARAFARLRAIFGEDVVFRAVLPDRHLPGAAWEPMVALGVPRPRHEGHLPLVRRIRSRPRPLAAPPRSGAWCPMGAATGAVARLDGPYRVAGGWWRKPVARDYYYAELQSGALLWLYQDAESGRWFLQGHVA